MNIPNLRLRPADALFLLGALLLFAPFFLFPGLYAGYAAFNKAHPFLMSALKFAVLATAGEALGLRIRSGVYHQPGFGLLPRAFYWGLFGLAIQAAFIVFASGVPQALERLGLFGPPALTAFAVSLAMNAVFAPVLMVAHKVTDAHVLEHGGAAACVLLPVAAGRHLRELDWDVMWGFVLKKTIPFFWVPAHTVTFLLPPEWRALFAALLGAALGGILAVASAMARERKPA